MDHRDAAEIARIVDELHEVVRVLEHDPSPHAPEIPYPLKERFAELFAFFGMVYPT